MTGGQCKKISYHQRLDFSKNWIWQKLIKIVPKWNAQTNRYEYDKTHVPQWKVVINQFCCIHVMHWWIEGLWAKKCNLRFYFYMMLNNTHKYRLCNDERERSPSLLLWHLNWWKCQCSNEVQCKQDTQCSSDVKVDTAIQCQLQYQWNQDTIVQ